MVSVKLRYAIDGLIENKECIVIAKSYLIICTIGEEEEEKKKGITISRYKV